MASVSAVSLPEPEQRSFSGRKVPHVLQWESPEKGETSDATQWLQKNRAVVDAALSDAGAVLFRGFPLKTAEDFDAFVRAFSDYEDLPYEESLSFAVRLQVTGRVCTTNEGKTGGQVFHHEQAQTPFWPSKIFFFCETPADEGGATAVCPSDAVLARLAERHPQFVADAEAKGVKYTAYMAASNDASKGAGRSWKSFFGCDSVAAVEARMAELGYTWQWLENETLRCTSPALPAVRVAPGPAARRVFFNQLVAQIANATDFHDRSGAEGKVEDVLEKYITFGDGSKMDAKILNEAKQLCEDVAVEMVWQPGDVALLDNYLVMHARRAFEGKRRVLASLVR